MTITKTSNLQSKNKLPRGSPQNKKINPLFDKSTGIHHQEMKSSGLRHSKSLTMNHISLFQMFPMEYAELIRETFRNLREKMPPQYQKIINKHKTYFRGRDHYRDEIIPTTYIKYDKMKFLVRGYALKHMNYCKYEITFDSNFLSGRKGLKYPNIIKSAMKIFYKIQLENGIIPIEIKGVHRDDYFLTSEMGKTIETLDKQIKDCSSLPSRSSIRELNYEKTKTRISNWNQNFARIAAHQRSLEIQDD